MLQDPGSVLGSPKVIPYWGDSAPFTLASSYPHFLSPYTLKQHLVASYSMTNPWCPVYNYEAQTHHHEGDSQSRKTDSLRIKGKKHQKFDYQLLWIEKAFMMQTDYMMCELLNISPLS